MRISIPQCLAGRSLSDIKQSLGALYINHVSGVHGLQGKVIRDVFASLDPHISLLHEGIVRAIHLLLAHCH